MSDNTSIVGLTTSIQCNFLKFIGAYTIILLFSGTILNVFTLWLFRKSKMITPMNCFMITLIILNLVATIIETPYIIYISINCRFIVR